MHCWLVGWWLWRMGCIAQDICLLYQLWWQKGKPVWVIIKSLTLCCFLFLFGFGGLICESAAAILYSFKEKKKQDHNSNGCLLESSRTHEMASRSSSPPANPHLRSLLPWGHLRRSCCVLSICVVLVYLQSPLDTFFQTSLTVTPMMIWTPWRPLLDG